MSSDDAVIFGHHVLYGIAKHAFLVLQKRGSAKLLNRDDDRF
jgi:hypothetical protein